MEIRRLGLVAGNGPLPIQVVREAIRKGVPVTIAAVEEEAERGIEQLAAAHADLVSVSWIGVGQLGKLLDLFRRTRVDKAILVGQVKHVRIYAPGSRNPFQHLRKLPDLRMIRLLASLEKKNTASLIEAIIRVLQEEGIEAIDSTLFLQDLLAEPGSMTHRQPSREEERDIAYGHAVACEIARLDVGQTIVVKDQAVVAVEAMEGTDETIRRAAALVNGERLTVIKVSRPSRDMRFDVPVIGPASMETFEECRVSALALDAGRTLIIDKPAVLARANDVKMTIVGR